MVQVDPTFENYAPAFPRPMLLDPYVKGEAEKQTWAMNSLPGPETAKAGPTAAFEALGSGEEWRVCVCAVLRLHRGQKRQQADTPGHTRDLCPLCRETSSLGGRARLR